MIKILKGAVVLLIAIAMIFSSVAIAKTIKEKKIKLSTIHEGSGKVARDAIIWDNGMEYDGICAAQYDTVVPFEAECADDFHFEVDTEVYDVHWIGGYWNGDNYSTVHWPWEIIFYNDDGTGTAPGTVYAGPFQYDYCEYCETFIEDTGEPQSGIYYEFSVYLPENILFPAYNKFWISIQGIGDFPPQSGWAYHLDPLILHEAVFRSDYFGYPDWTDWSEILPPDQKAMCFQLTQKGPSETSVDVEKYVWDPKNQQWDDADTESTALDIPICHDATFKIAIHNNGNIELTDITIKDKMHDSLKYIAGDPEPDDYYYDEPFHYMEWYLPGPLNPCETIEIYITAHVEGPECSIDFNYVFVEANGGGNLVSDDDYAYVHAYKSSKNLNMPFFNFLQSHPNMFPIIRQLLGL